MTSVLEDLHDATLVNVDFIWVTGIVDIHLRTASNPVFLLRIINATALHATRDFEWGPSAQVNAVTVSEESFAIEMQSGDVIRITGNINTPLKIEAN
ncbi:hypothetical protein [Hymenobacter sp. IS2118]|uniref:hypothetical protein n=1 Tax=Hymenobacter sp. IS2118 TaxID=1505605 RepID=UPI00126783D4|nr:hypothetical protein [Hymenobacter sp. IS2118]